MNGCGKYEAFKEYCRQSGRYHTWFKYLECSVFVENESRNKRDGHKECYSRADRDAIIAEGGLFLEHLRT